MKIEVGKYYRDRKENIVLITNFHSVEIFTGNLIEDEKTIIDYNENGECVGLVHPGESILRTIPRYKLDLIEEIETPVYSKTVKPGDKLKVKCTVERIAASGTIQCTNCINIPLDKFNKMVVEHEPSPDFDFEKELEPGMRFHYIEDFVTFCYKKKGSEQYIFYDEAQGILRGFTFSFMKNNLEFYEKDWID